MADLLLGVFCKKPRCGRFFASPFQRPPARYDDPREIGVFYRCPHCGATRYYVARDHVFAEADRAA
jgi:hypothetical protein